MKRTALILTVSLLVLISTIIWIVSPGVINLGDNLQFYVIFILVVFGLFVAFRRYNSERKGQPAEDELSKKILQKAAALSYYISLYLWLVVMYLTDKLKVDPEVMYGWGILGMGVIFALCWAFFNFRGIKNE